MDTSKYIGNVFLKVDDIKASGPIRVTITDVSEGRFGKPVLTFDDGTKLSVKATNSRTLARAYGMDGDNWIDRQVRLVLGQTEYDGKPRESILVKPVSKSIETMAQPKPDLDDEIPF